MVPGRIATSQTEHEGIMAALREHDAESAARLALLHKRSVRDAVSTLVDQPDDRASEVADETGSTARLRTRAAS
jgi:DNA-binding GntR family transcriptional regulator